MTQAQLKVDGLDELLRAVGRIDKALTRELRKELRVGVGGAFVKDVKQRVERVGLVDRGNLRSSIRPAVSGADVVIRSKPLNPGPRSRLGYGAVYEFGGGGRRAFLDPTRDEWQRSGKLEQALSGFVNWLETEWRS